MSQAKVDKYKEFKKNRKEELEKEKKAQQRTALIWKCVAIVLALGILVALGITIYNDIKARIDARPDYNREEMILQDVAGILETTAEPTEAPTTAAEETTEAPETTAATDATNEETQPAPSEAETTAAASN